MLNLKMKLLLIKKYYFNKKFGKYINTALCTSAPENVVKRLIKIKSKIFGGTHIWMMKILKEVYQKNYTKLIICHL